MTLPAGRAAASGTDEQFAEVRWSVLQEIRFDDLIYRVVPGAIVAPRIAESDRAILGAYVRILRDIVGDVPRRYFDDEEKGVITTRRIEEKRREIQSGIDERRRALDRERIEIAADEADEVPNPDEDEEVQRLRTRRDALDAIAPTDLLTPDFATLQLPDEDEYRLRWTLSDPSGVAREMEADLFLYIVVEPLEELFIVTVHLYLPTMETDREVLRIVAAPDDVPPQLERYRREIVNAVAAAQLAEVSITAMDAEGRRVEDARLYLGDELIGVGSGRDGYARAGTYRIRGITPDGREQTRGITLAEGDQREVTLLFTEDINREITITSSPPGAAVYRGVLWQGYTPLKVARPPEAVSYTLTLEEYHDSRVDIGPETPDIVDRVLISQEYDWEADTERARKKFYRSFGAFALSVGVPILIYGTYQDYAALYPGGVARSDLSIDEQDRLQGEVDTLFYSYYGSIALSAGLFTHMIWRLATYIRTAQGYHTR